MTYIIISDLPNGDRDVVVDSADSKEEAEKLVAERQAQDSRLAHTVRYECWAGATYSKNRKK